MSPIQHFRHCPRCARPLSRSQQPACVACDGCGFVLYFNPAVSVAAFVTEVSGRLLLIRRAREPARGRLAIPGGFVDFAETAESALRRELLEEVGLEVVSVRYLCSEVNDYHFKEVAYPVLDLYFTAEVAAGQTARALEDVSSVNWLAPDDISLDEIAFPSMRKAMKFWLSLRHRTT